MESRFIAYQSPSGRWIVRDTQTGRIRCIEYARTRALFKCSRLNREHEEAA